MSGVINLDIGEEDKRKFAAMANAEQRSMTAVLKRWITEKWDGHEASDEDADGPEK